MRNFQALFDLTKCVRLVIKVRLAKSLAEINVNIVLLCNVH